MTDNQTLDPCGCCEGLEKLTPADQTNPPGLPALAYRVGTHGSFKRSMLAGLAGPGGIPALTTRLDDDPAIAMLDVAAVLLDVLTFYQERIANEGFLRTATERLSVLELARTIGYELKPGVAASTHLAFELETAPSAPASAAIPVGTKVQSVPGQDELPQTFETVEPITARREWNQLRPQTSAPIAPAFGDTRLYLQGTTTNLRPGDALLVIGDERRSDPSSERWDFRRVVRITPMATADPPHTLVEIEHGLGSGQPFVAPAASNPRVYALRLRASLFGHSAPDWRAMPRSLKASYLGLTEAELDQNANRALLLSHEWPGFSLAEVSGPPSDVSSGTGLYGEYFNNANLTARKLARTDATIDFNWATGSPAPGTIDPDTFSVRWTGWIQPKVTGQHTFWITSDDGVRLWIDGELIINNWAFQPATEKNGTTTKSLEAGKKYDLRLEYFEQGGAALINMAWGAPGLTREIVPAAQLYPRDIAHLYLDAVYGQLVAGGWAVVSVPEYQEVYLVEQAVEEARTGFTLSTKTTRLTLRGEGLRERFNDRLRETVVFAQSEELPIASRPIRTPLAGRTITLDRLVPDLAPGRTLIVSGKRARVCLLHALKLAAASGSSSRDQAAGESLLLEASPQRLPSGAQLWTLTDKHGFTGTVVFASQAVADSSLVLAPALLSDAVVSEVVTIEAVAAQSDPTRIELASDLLRTYDRASVVIYGNVAAATHGETRREVLGSGDAARAFQTFALKQKPLTFISAPTASGAESTLRVRVNDVQWEERPALYGLGPRDRAYITRRTDDGTVTLTFGDGVSGARPPTGDENIIATYRTGVGAGGMLKAGQLSLLLTRPLGVQKVTNPLPPGGAADPESRDQARSNAPFTVLTLDRIVSLRDFEDFARAYAGIGKAQATLLWDGEQRLVHLTIAAAVRGGIDHTIDPRAPLFAKLRQAVDAARDTVQRLEIASYEPIFFRLEARVLVDPAYQSDRVLGAVRAALRDAFAFERRDFGQPVARSGVLAVIQAVPGVGAVFLDQLVGGGAVDTGMLLLAERARRAPAAGGASGALLPAQLLLIDLEGSTVTEVKP